jgi:uncharacterized membrane protein YgdD (TMEM256/DUF423 family)
MNKKTVITGLTLIVIAILFGAFAAHGLKKIISIEKIISFEVGVRYQMYVGLLLLILGLNQSKLPIGFNFTRRLLTIGVLFFSGSIYLLALQEIVSVRLAFLGPVTPVGGLLLVIGISYLLWAIFKQNQDEK